jgi:hypothetical protein
MACIRKTIATPINGHYDLSRYAMLHPEGKQLIFGWLQRAWGYKDCRQNEAFEPFIFTWFAFNGWAACVTDTDKDRDIINILANDQTINNDFRNAIIHDRDLSTSVHTLIEYFPVFDVKTLRKLGLLHHQQDTRHNTVMYYLNRNANKYEPICWKNHYDSGETVPVDWEHIINAIYKVRCNLFHGEKSIHSEMDQIIVHSSYLVLVYFLIRVGYLNP